jgi:HAMP domain-containing protein/glycosyltransferase involved in cell wall biosynthesis
MSARPLAAGRRLLDRTPLRVKLIVAVLALVTVALVLIGLASSAALEGYLVGRLDDQLALVAGRYTHEQDEFGPGPGGDRGHGPPSPFLVQRFDANGRLTGSVPTNSLDTDEPPPRLPGDAAWFSGHAGKSATVPASSGDGRWRVVVEPTGDSGSVVVAASLDGIDSTTRQLRTIDLVVSLVVLALLAGAGAAIVRASLRPLVEIEQTARAIAAGDLTRRVPDRDPRTEVGRLGRALNTMLAQIESAFSARAASEASARRSEDRMRRFVADASHELRTPLTTIRGFAELYRQGAARDPAELDRLMRRIEDQAARMGLLVDDLLLLARSTSSAPWTGARSTCSPWPPTPSPTPPPSPPTAGSSWCSPRATTGPATPWSCSATSSGCARSWPTWSATPCATPRPGARSRSGSGRRPSTAGPERPWRWSTTAPGSPPSRPSGCSSASTGPTRPAPAATAAPASACRSWPPWSPSTAAPSRSTASPAAAPASGWSCPWPLTPPRAAAHSNLPATTQVAPRRGADHRAMQTLPRELPETRAHGQVVEVVVPVHNEELVLEASIRRLHGYLAASFPFPFRITVADNASTDATWPLALRLAAQLPEVRAVHLDQKGRGRALRQVWEASDADVVAYMDVDLSTGLEALLPLVAPLVSGHSDLAIGTRLANGSAVVRGPRRELVSRCYNLLLRTTLRARFSDAQCGFKAGRTEVVQALLPEVEDQAWFFDTELLLAAQRGGLRIHEVPVDWVEDTDSRVDLVRTALDDLRGMARVARRQLPSFAAIGVVSTLAYLGLFWLLRSVMGAVAANALALLATAVANAAATLVRFVPLRSWVFHPHRTRPEEIRSR